MDKLKLSGKKKILILGSSGSGKSTLAQKISKEHDMPVFFYDQIRWLENWKQPSKEEIKSQLEEITKLDSYILEGTFSKKMMPIVKDCDRIIVLKVPTILCTYRILKRTFLSFITGKNGAREDLPQGCNEKLGIGYLRFIKYTLTYNKELEQMFEKLKGHENKIVVSIGVKL